VNTGYRTTQNCPFLKEQLLGRSPRPAYDLLYPSPMSKSSKRSRRTRKTTDRSSTTDIVTQLEVAVHNPHAALVAPAPMSTPMIS